MKYKENYEADVTIVNGDTGTGEYEGSVILSFNEKIEQINDDGQMILKDHFSINPVNIDIQLSKLMIKPFIMAKAIAKSAARNLNGNELGMLLCGATLHIVRNFCAKDSDMLDDNGKVVGKYSRDIYNTKIISVTMPKEPIFSFQDVLFVVKENNKVAKEAKNDIDFNFA